MVLSPDRRVPYPSAVMSIYLSRELTQWIGKRVSSNSPNDAQKGQVSLVF